MKKRILWILTAVLLLILTGAFIYIGMLAPIITGYAAKNLSSGIFLGHRTQQSLEKEDLNFSFIKFNKNKVNPGKKEVVSRFLFWKSKAVYNEGLGCTLVRDFSEEEVFKMDYPQVELPASNPDTIPWPAGDLLTDTIPHGINMVKLQAALNQAFADTGSYKGTFAVTVVYKDQIVAEKFAGDLNRNNRFLSWSMAKSFTNALIGILVKEGKLDINNPVPRPEWAGDERKNITLNNLMHMNSGLEWNEDYGNLSDVTVMLHKEGDMGDFAAAKKQIFRPDSVWLYSSGTTNIVTDYLRSLFAGDAEYFAFPRNAFFNKTGLRSVVFEPDASGTFVGSSYLYASMRDYARFGLLYLHKGNWLGEQILPDNWVAYTTTPAHGSGGQYGAFFWLNRSGKYPGVPEDMFSCEGHDGQFIFIVPSKQLVVVRTGHSPSGTYNFKAFLKEIVECVEN
jgi:CubicO group peptidase (beta-lactamase class C family)